MKQIETEILVIGGGPAGYTAALEAASRGKKTVLIEKESQLGGTCLNWGCIPSKALLSAVKVIEDAKEASNRGIGFAVPQVDLAKLNSWKDSVLTKLAGGIQGLMKRKNVEVIQGRAAFQDSGRVSVKTNSEEISIKFEKAVIATGSNSALPKAFDIKDPRVITSKEALELKEIPKKLLVVGGGYIGMELGTVYAALGSEVTVVEMLDSILTGADPDLTRPFKKKAAQIFKAVHLGTKVTKLVSEKEGIRVSFEAQDKSFEEIFSQVLISIGRVPHTAGLSLEKTRVKLDEKGFIETHEGFVTDDPSIFAIGDVAGGALLAHKASHEAKILIEALVTGEKPKKSVIPFVVFTHPEIAWCGLTETEARAKNIPVDVARFPWSASGRAQTLAQTEGVTKLIAEPSTGRILGAGVAGCGADELISEAVVLIEKGTTIRELKQMIHPHPTLSETFVECADSFRI